MTNDATSLVVSESVLARKIHPWIHTDCQHKLARLASALHCGTSCPEFSQSEICRGQCQTYSNAGRLGYRIRYIERAKCHRVERLEMLTRAIISSAI